MAVETLAVFAAGVAGVAGVAVYLCILYTLFTLVEASFDIVPHAQLIIKIGVAIWFNHRLLDVLSLGLYHAPEQPAHN